jgi:hypothetical protein
MRGRVLVILGVLALFPLRLLPDCAFAPIASGQFRSTIYDIALDGTDLWAATGYGVALYDTTVDPPVLRRSSAIPGRTISVRAAGGVALVGSASILYRVTKGPSGLLASQVGDLGGTINDMLVSGSYLYIATSSGLGIVSLVDSQHPTIVQQPSPQQTSTGAATAMAVLGNTLYVIDGDSSLEVFSIAQPDKTVPLGSFATFPRPLSVNAQDGRLLVSDGFQTQIFGGSAAQMTAVGTPFPTAVTELASISGGVAITAGPDLRLRALDLSTSPPVNLFAADLPAGAGTVNRVFRIIATADRAYVAAGDAGLRSFDTGTFKAPFPIRSFPFPSLTSLRIVGTVAFVSGPTGLQELSLGTSTVTSLHQWTSGNDEVVRDALPGLLLTSTDRDITLWSSADPTVTPSAVSRVSLNSIRSAVLVGTTAYAVTSDHVLWSVPMTQPGALPARVPIAPSSPSFVVRSRNARGENSLALADINVAGTTTVRYFDAGDPTATPQTASFDGVATSGISLSLGRVAALTFRGLNVVDFTGATPSTRIVAGSAGVFGTQLALSGSTLLLLTSSGLQVFDIDSGVPTRTFALPLQPVAIAADQSDMGAVGSTAAALTSDSFTTINWKSASEQPVPTGVASQNAFYSKVTASSDRLGLLDRGSLDSYSFLELGGLPYDFLALRQVQGIVDVAALPRGFAVLGGSGKLSLLSASGVVLSELIVDNAPDALPLSVYNVGGAIWVSVSKGCVPGPCQKVTTVFDPRNGALAATSTLSGGVIDVVTSGPVAYGLFDLPAEIRVLAIDDPFHPSIGSSRSTVGLSPIAPASVTYSAATKTVYVLADKLYAFSDAVLSAIGPVGAVPAATSSFGQSVRIDGGCALVAGRTEAPQLYAIDGPLNWRANQTPAVPSAIRSVATRPGYFYLLTERSLEVWSSVLQEPKVKRHAAH